MSWCLIVYLFHVYKLKAVSTEILHVKIEMDNLDGFHVQIILSQLGEWEHWGIIVWNWAVALGLSEFFLQIVHIEEKASQSTRYDFLGITQPRGSLVAPMDHSFA